jgi:hypothetical protein
MVTGNNIAAAALLAVVFTMPASAWGESLKDRVDRLEEQQSVDRLMRELNRDAERRERARAEPSPPIGRDYRKDPPFEWSPQEKAFLACEFARRKQNFVGPCPDWRAEP